LWYSFFVSGSYHVEVETSAAKQIQRLQRHDQQRVMTEILALADNPRPVGYMKMAGAVEAYRIRVGVFRVVYIVDDTIRVVTVTRVGHRREVYRR
jgi:mRNA interferase RelE/StbE